jgi:glyoxylase-like metal-dependent hydrolase (beta-lactamase superfamily II)
MALRIRPLPAALAILGLLGGAGCALKTTPLGEGVAVVSGDQPGPDSGVVKTHFGPVVIDGQPGAAPGESLVEAALKFSGYESVPYLILTSHHADHTLSNGVFRLAEIISTEAARQALLERSAAERKLLHDRLGIAGTKSAELVTPTVTFSKSMTLYAGWPKDKIREIRLLEMPAGAAPGNLVVYLPKEKVLFAGDLVTNGVFPYMGDADLGEWTRALDELNKLDFDKLVPGHGAPGGKELVKSTAKFLTDLCAAVAKAKASGRKLEDAKKDLVVPGYEKWSAYKELLPIAVERLWDQKLPAAPAAQPEKPVATPAFPVEMPPSPAPKPSPSAPPAVPQPGLK